MDTDSTGTVDAYVIGEHDELLASRIPNYFLSELKARELWREGNVVMYDDWRPLNYRWIVITRTHFDTFYEWV